MFMCMAALSVCMCNTCVSDTLGCQKSCSNPWGWKVHIQVLGTMFKPSEIAVRY